MKINDFLNVKPETLAQEQEIRLREYVSDKLTKIATMIIAGNYKSVREHLADSPGGDDHGRDNTYISFEELALNVDKYGFCNDDIGSVITRLEELAKMRKNNEQK